MKFNKCSRCGCFFSSLDDVCPSCKSKDEIDIRTLKNFLDNTDKPVSLKNINRYIETNEFTNYKNILQNDDFSNVKIKL